MDKEPGGSYEPVSRIFPKIEWDLLPTGRNCLSGRDEPKKGRAKIADSPKVLESRDLNMYSAIPSTVPFRIFHRKNRRSRPGS